MSTLPLRTLAISASVAILGGCAAARKPSTAATPVFTPDSNFEKAWTKVSVVEDHPIIDVHTHAFNARYLPLKRLVAARKWGTGIWFLPGSWIEAAAVFITSSTPMNEVEAADRKRRVVDWERKHGPADTDGKRLTAILDTNNQSLQVVWPGSKNAKVNELGHASTNRKSPAELAKKIRGTATEISPSGWIAYQLFLKWSLRQLVGALFSHDSAHTGDREYLASMLVSLMSSDTEVRERMAKAFPSVDLFVYQNMDLVPSFYQGYGTYALSYSRDWYGEVSAMPRIRKMCADSNGRMIQFVAWNPFRTLDWTPGNNMATSMSVVKLAVANGAKGVKFYPPLGYRPSGNDFSKVPKPMGREARKQWEHRYGNHHTGEQLDAINEELFAYCETHDIPIFTHCNTGEFRAYDDAIYAEMANPRYWIPVLARHPNLRLCFGHAGGVTDWYQGFGGTREKVKGEASWGVAVRDLCRKYRNVYCEFGIHEDVANAKLVEPFYHTLLVELPSKNLSNGERGNFPLAEKVMYGSDYYMPINCSPQKYLEGFQKLFSLDGMGDYKKKFFYQNAEKYLKRSVANRWRAR